MPRHGRGTESITGGACKIQKRGCRSASSSSSSVLQNYRFKRAIPVRKRRGSTTPVPAWKVNTWSHSPATGNSEIADFAPSHNVGNGMQAPVSARKLANALWGLKNIHPPQKIEELGERRYRKEMRLRSRMLRPVHSGSLARRLSDPSYSPDSEVMTKWSRTGSNRIKLPVAPQNDQRARDYPSNTALMETGKACSHGHTTMDYGIRNKSYLKDLRNGLTTSKEILKLLDRIWSVKEKHPSRVSLVSALHIELDRACLQVNHLVEGHNSNRNEFHLLKRQFMEDKSAWKRKEQEGGRAAVQFIMDELELEKKSRKRAERLNKQLGMELAEMKTSLLKAVRDLENERSSRELIEQVCNELVKGIGEEKAEAEELKRESIKAREELEKEREMLHIADELREERLQMKLSEAKFQFEEKNAAINQMRNKLEAFLTTKRTEEHGGFIVDERRGEVDDVEVIELSMDSKSKSYCWSYATEISEEGKATNRDQVSRIGFSSDGTKGFRSLVDVPVQEKLFESSNLVDDRAQKLDRERYISVKELRDRMMSASMIGLSEV